MLYILSQKFVRREDRDGRGSVAHSSVGSQFTSQLAALRARIGRTSPHYIRCLKPNNELKPDTFDPRMIVEQLQCGGVLEAVRVSRAGEFRAAGCAGSDGFCIRCRHSILLTRSIPKTKYLPFRHSSGYPTRYTHETFSARYYILGYGHRSSRDTEELVVAIARELYRTSTEAEIRSNVHGTSFPASLDDYDGRDFTSRCALAGLQMGRTKGESAQLSTGR